MHIHRTPVTNTLREQLKLKFEAYAMERIPNATAYEYTSAAFCIHDAKKQLLGAVVVQLRWKNLYIEALYVDPQYRQQGLGRRLMQRVLAYAHQQGCRFVTLETWSYQSPGFYKKLGFQEEFVRSGYAEGISLHVFRRDLPSGP